MMNIRSYSYKYLNDKRLNSGVVKYRVISPISQNYKPKNFYRISSMRNLNQRNKLYLKNDSNINKSFPLNLQNNYSLRNQSSENKNPFLFNEIDKNKVPSYEEYDELIDQNLKDYQIIEIKKKKSKKPSISTKENISINNENIKNNETTSLKNTTNNNSIQIFENSKKLIRNLSEPYYKISIKDKNYQNPMESFNVISSNNNIFNQISDTSLLRQRYLFDNSVKKFEKYSSKFKVKMPKIRISDLASNKLLGDIPMVNLIKNNNINENNENNQNIKEDYSLPQIEKNKNELKLFSYFKYPSKNFPEGKQQFALCIINKFLILSGGISTNMKQMFLWKLNLETLEWSKINTTNHTNCRFDHTSVFFQNKIYFYGGRVKIDKSTVLSGLEIFDLETNTFHIPNISGGPQKRRNHISVLLGNQMLIHGGIGDDNEIFNDCYLLNLQPLKWISPIINKYKLAPQIFGHACCLAISSNILHNKKFNIYHYPDNDIFIKKNNNKYNNRGLYVFGGSMKEIGGLTNNLWVLVLGQRPIFWNKIDTKGIPPSPRIYHTMDYFEKSNCLIVHGGRNDNLSNSSALSNTFLLDLANFTWIKVDLYSNISGFKIISRYGHKSIIVSNKLIIFGGMNNNNYIGSTLFIVNLDFHYSILLKTTQQLMLESLKGNTDLQSKRKLKELKKELQRLQLGVVSQINLPPIK